MKPQKVNTWKSKKTSRLYLEGVRGAIPLSRLQIDIILYLVGKAMPEVKSFLDLGCGDGILGRALLARYPDARGIFLDFSKTMIRAARQKASKGSPNLFFVTRDYASPAWVRSVKRHGKFDVIVSGFSIHHQPDKRKKSLYRELFGLLAPGGFFLNLEHVASPSPWLGSVFEEYFIDALYRYHRRSDPAKNREEIARAYYRRPDKAANILAPVEAQCRWLRETGFKEADCYLKLFELSLFGGRKPKGA